MPSYSGAWAWSSRLNSAWAWPESWEAAEGSPMEELGLLLWLCLCFLTRLLNKLVKPFLCCLACMSLLNTGLKACNFVKSAKVSADVGNPMIFLRAPICFLISLQVRTEGSTEGDLSPRRPQAEDIFGISISSRIGRIIYSYLCLIPELANDEEKMAETTELYDSLLKLELIDHFERMTTKKRMSTVSMQQWLTGAAFHLHMRIHQVRRLRKTQTKMHTLIICYVYVPGIVSFYTMTLTKSNAYITNNAIQSLKQK